MSGNVDVTVSEYFTVDGDLFGTRAADAYKAIYKDKSQIVCLWLGKVRIEKDSPAMTDFFRRMAILSRIQPPVSSIISYGLDVEGYPFAVLEGLDGQPIRGGAIEMAEAERRFIACLRLMDRLHQSGVVMGDISASSFWYEREGDISLIGVIGSHDINQDLAIDQTDLTVFQYLAPEQAGDCVEDPDFPFSEDVFALGVLGYFLLTGVYPWTNEEVLRPGLERFANIKPPSEIEPKAPAWADEVLLKCLEADPSARFSNAGQILKAIFAIRERALALDEAHGESGAGQPRKNQETQVEVFPTQTILAIRKREEEAREAELRALEEEKPRHSPVKLLVLGASSFLLLTILCIWMLSSLGGDKEATANLTQAEPTAAPEPAADALFRGLIESKEPDATSKLVKHALGAASPAERQAAEAAVIERAERHGLVMSSKAVRHWLDNLPRAEVPPAYEAVLKSLDPSAGQDERSSALRAAYADAPPLALRLASALAFDTNKLDEFKEVLAQLVGDSLKMEIAGAHSALAIMLAHPELSVIFGEEILSRWEQIPRDDIYWLLNDVGTKSGVNSRGIANVALKTNIVPPLKRGLLTLVRDRHELSPEVASALVKAGFGKLDPSDVAELRSWKDPESEGTLLLISADASDEGVLAAIFEILSDRQIVSEPAASLIGWVRAHAWESRAKLMKAIGVLSNQPLVSEDDLRKQLGMFEPHVKDTTLLAIFLSSSSPWLVRMALEKHGNLIGPSAILKLLRHPDPGVRSLAAKYVVRFDDVEALRAAVDLYEKEKDPTVRQTYKDAFFVLKKRGAIKGD